MPLTRCSVDDLLITDDRAFTQAVPGYAALKEVLRQTQARFHVLPSTSKGKSKGERWDRALLLNLTFWQSEGGDVVTSRRVPADVVCHAAWHAAAARALGLKRKEAPTAQALFLGEAIASAYDAALVGFLLPRGASSSFLSTQVPAMAEAAQAAGATAKAFETMLSQMAAEPGRAFEALRQLLFDASLALFAADGPAEGLKALQRFDGHPFAALLHHYELSTWVLYARAYGTKSAAQDKRCGALDQALRRSTSPLYAAAELLVTPSGKSVAASEGRASTRTGRSQSKARWNA